MTDQDNDDMKSPSEIAEDLVINWEVNEVEVSVRHKKENPKSLVSMIASAIESERKRAEGLEQRELQSIKYLNRLATWAQQDPTGPWEKYKIQEWVLNQIKGALGQKIEETDWQPKALSSHEGREEEPVRAKDGGTITKRKALDLGVEILNYMKERNGRGESALVNYWIRRYMMCIDNEKFIEPSILRAQNVVEKPQEGREEEGNELQIHTTKHPYLDSKNDYPDCVYCHPPNKACVHDNGWRWELRDKDSRWLDGKGKKYYPTCPFCPKTQERKEGL